jgi:hypothetical protein
MEAGYYSPTSERVAQVLEEDPELLHLGTIQPMAVPLW